MIRGLRYVPLYVDLDVLRSVRVLERVGGLLEATERRRPGLAGTARFGWVVSDFDGYLVEHKRVEMVGARLGAGISKQSFL